MFWVKNRLKNNFLGKNNLSPDFLGITWSESGQDQTTHRRVHKKNKDPVMQAYKGKPTHGL
jgi:hypothetical protein